MPQINLWHIPTYSVVARLFRSNLAGYQTWQMGNFVLSIESPALVNEPSSLLQPHFATPSSLGTRDCG